MPQISAHFGKVIPELLDSIEAQFDLSPESLIDLTNAFLGEIATGLGNYNHPMAMIPTFVTGVPDGTEEGTFLALDLGGTNLRVCEVTLHGDKTFSLRQQKYKVSDTLKTGEATALFDYLADSVDAFLTSTSPTETNPDNPFNRPPSPNTPYRKDNLEPGADFLHLGLTFSFPVEQTALGSGTILTWTKGFSAKHAVGQDVVKLLQDAFDRKHMHVKCVALVNDTVGALLSRAYTAGGCLLGAIFGTGTNGAYVEQVANITKLRNSPAAAVGGSMVVNTEWGAFNNTRSHLPTTPFDNSLDRTSINPRFQAFEKFISGMYLGEITRHILTSLIDSTPTPAIFNGKSTSVLNTQWGMDTSVMSEIEEAWEGIKDKGIDYSIPIPAKVELPHEDVPKWSEFDEKKLTPGLVSRLTRIQGVIAKSMGYEEGDVTLRDAALVRWACMLVTRRAAQLSGMAVAAVLVQTGHATIAGRSGDKKKDTGRIIVGVDGSLIEHYPNFERSLRVSLRALVGKDVEERVDIGLAKDGSGVGAALCALQALKQGV